METLKAKTSWEEYLSAKPTTRDIAWIFFCNDQEGISKLAWEELKSRKDKKKEHIIMPILYCRKLRWIRDEAWAMFLEMNPSKKEMERITSYLDPSDPIVEDIIAKYGTNKEYLLQKAKKEM